MQQTTISSGKDEIATERSFQAEGEQKQKKSPKKHGFANLDPATQLQVFLSWLPQELHDVPGIDWKHLSPEIMCHCVKTIKNSPDAAILAVTAGSLIGSMSLGSQYTDFKRVYSLFQSFRAQGLMHHVADLKQEQIWYQWATGQNKTTGTGQIVRGYLAVAAGHFPLYLLRLEVADRQRMQQYALPMPPADLTKRYFPVKQLRVAQASARKEKTDVLVPLYPVLRQMVRFRKQLAERTLITFREACRKVAAGEATLPYQFQHTDTIPEANRDARTIAEVKVYGREVTMNFVLWDKRTWVQHHSHQYCEEINRQAELGILTYSSEQNCFFVQFDGPSSDCLWFGEFVEHRLLQRFDKDGCDVKGYEERWKRAQQLGFFHGCVCARSGLLTPGNRWFALAGERSAAEGKQVLIFDFESLYRGILFGAALTMIALSNGSRVSELLQMSGNKERRITHTETVLALGEDGQPILGNDRKPLKKQVKLHFQHLLPKGAKTDEERQLFPLSKECVRLLGEIKKLLEETYGTIPVIEPARSNLKSEHLKAEQYLFQWDSSPDGSEGAISTAEVQALIRFMLHGLDLYTTQGKPIHVSVHILRHVMATHARHYRHVAPEAIAYFFLHHRLKELTGRDASPSDISEYYTLMTKEQRFAAISTDLDEQEEMDHKLLQAAPTARDLEQMNEDLHAVFELWHALHPTALGNCGCPGLCPRGNDRALCLGCSYLVTDPERLQQCAEVLSHGNRTTNQHIDALKGSIFPSTAVGAALAWRESYAKQAELLEVQENVIDARQARIKVQQLDDVINVMRLQLQAEADGSYIPLHKVLPSPHRKREDRHEEED